MFCFFEFLLSLIDFFFYQNGKSLAHCTTFLAQYEFEVAIGISSCPVANQEIAVQENWSTACYERIKPNYVIAHYQDGHRQEDKILKID